MDRRDFLKLLIDVPVIGLVGCVDATNKDKRLITSKDSENLVEKIEETGISEQLFVDSNPRINQDFDSKKHCYMLVHPGFADYRDDPFYKILIGFERFYGNYNNYLDNISKLVQYLNNSDELAIFAIEERDFYNENIPKKELRPSNSAMILVTEDGKPMWKEYVETEKGSELQRPELIIYFLKKNGIQEIRFAGEWARGGEGKWDEEAGCLLGWASALDGFFDINGVEGCIYPTIPNPYDKNKKYDRVLEKLYNEQVTLDSVLNK